MSGPQDSESNVLVSGPGGPRSSGPSPAGPWFSHHVSVQLCNEDKAPAFTQSKELFWVLSAPSCMAEKQTEKAFQFALFPKLHLPLALRTPATPAMPTSAPWLPALCICLRPHKRSEPGCWHQAPAVLGPREKSGCLLLVSQ